MTCDGRGTKINKNIEIDSHEKDKHGRYIPVKCNDRGNKFRKPSQIEAHNTDNHGQIRGADGQGFHCNYKYIQSAIIVSPVCLNLTAYQ